MTSEGDNRDLDVLVALARLFVERPLDGLLCLLGVRALRRQNDLAVAEKVADDSCAVGTAIRQPVRTLPRVSTHREYEPSPAPSDADLWPGEPPFTAWGQCAEGAIDLRVFDQGIWWVDVTQRPHRLTEMSPQYLTNVITHLHEHVDHFHQGSADAA